LHLSTEDLVAVAARATGLALSYWLLAATALSCARRVVPGWKHLHPLDWVTPPPLRRTLDRALLLGLGASLAVGGLRPAGASARPASPNRVVVTAAASRPVSSDEPVPRTPVAPAPTATRRDPPTADALRPGIAIVRPGDNLWVIARRAVEARDGQATDGTVATYWRQVIAANASTLRSGNPNLIFPDERIVLPAG
jgi:nucleoid-associated protein YgaU